MSYLSYRDVESFLKAGLATKGYEDTLPAGTGGTKPMPRFDVGPFAIPALQKLTPGTMVFATVGNGSGLEDEGAFDLTFITIRVLGPQNDYDSAEALAYDVDRVLLALAGNGMIGSTRVRYVNRTGGPPQLVDFDASSRYHFQTTYITPAATGL